jgi:hypothetical protein
MDSKGTEYIMKLVKRPLSNEAIEMITYFEELERKERAIKEFGKYLQRLSDNSPKGEERMIYFKLYKDLKKFIK